MKTHKLVKFIITLFSGILLISCDDYGKPEPYTPYQGEDAPTYTSKVYINNQLMPVNQYKFKSTYIEKEKSLTIAGDTIVKFPIKVTSPFNKKIVIKCSIDENYVDTYNKENEADFILLPATHYTLENSEVVIEEGKIKSMDSISIKVNKSADFRNNTKDYLLPIKIESVDGKNKYISSNMSRVNILGESSLVLDNIYLNNDAVEGEEIDRSNWNVTVNNSYNDSSFGVSNLIDENKMTMWLVSLNVEPICNIDLGKTATLKGMRIHPGNYYGNLSYSPKKMTIYTSANGKKWIEQGTFSVQNQLTAEESYNIKFKSAVATRYVRVKTVESFSSYYSGISEIYMIK